MVGENGIGIVAVIGAGTMGRGIAQVSAQAGCAVALHDADAEAMRQARRVIEATLEKGLARGKIDPDEKEAALERLRLAGDLSDAVMDADLVIEAIPEDLHAKERLFAELDARAPGGAILASNTSSLGISRLARVTDRPERVVGLHFFNPVHLMKLVEVIVLSETDEDVRKRVVGFAHALGKTPIVVSDSPGFATSRLGLALGLEAMRMVEEGVASAHDIDLAMEMGYNHPMGPLKLTDLVGLDIRLAIADHLSETIGPRFAPPAILRRHVVEGKLGKKTGEGFYRWEGGEPVVSDG